MRSIKISEKTKAKIEETQGYLLLSKKKKISQSELLEKIVLFALEDPELLANILDIEQFPSLEEKTKVTLILDHKPKLVPAPLLYQDEWEN